MSRARRSSGAAPRSATLAPRRAPPTSSPAERSRRRPPRGRARTPTAATSCSCQPGDRDGGHRRRLHAAAARRSFPTCASRAEVTPGNALHFATAYSLDGFGSGLLVDSYAGRPTKVEGNPDHPQDPRRDHGPRSGLPLGLYDDDRARQLRHRGRPLAWRTFLAELAVRANQLAEDGGAKLRFLVEPDRRRSSASCARASCERFPRRQVRLLLVAGRRGRRRGRAAGVRQAARGAARPRARRRDPLARRRLPDRGPRADRACTASSARAACRAGR